MWRSREKPAPICTSVVVGSTAPRTPAGRLSGPRASASASVAARSTMLCSCRMLPLNEYPLEQGQRFLGEVQPRSAELFGDAAEEVLRQRSNVFAARPQGREFDVDHVEAEQQIFAKPTRLHLFVEAPIWSRRECAPRRPLRASSPPASRGAPAARAAASPACPAAARPPRRATRCHHPPRRGCRFDHPQRP